MKRTLRMSFASAFLCAHAVCACEGTPQVISAGREDSFRGPPKPVSPSPQLLASYVAKIYPKGRFRGFDQDGGNLLFLTSLRIPNRKICSAQFEIRVRRPRSTEDRQSFDFNDYLQIGFAPFAATGERKSLFRAGMWRGDPPELLVKTVRIPLPAAELNRFVLLTDGSHYLDIMLHNDTAVDYVKLILRFE